MSEEMNHDNTMLDPKTQETLKGIYDSLTDEQKEKVDQCKTMDELMQLAGKEGIELPDDMLDAVSGGFDICSGDHDTGSDGDC